MSTTYSLAQSYIDMNSDYLGWLENHPRVARTRIDGAKEMVYVAVSADISALFLIIAPRVLVEETGTA